jgi:putative tryptophan/tyrosine transport system substrate-binding protein
MSRRGLLAYGSRVREDVRRAAPIIDTRLTGPKPAELPVEQPTQFELIINLKTA